MPTSALSLAVKRCVAVRRICVDPQPRTMFSGLTPSFFAIASMRSPPARRIAARRAAALAERGAHGLHHGLARPERILVAAQADHARRDRFERRFERGPEAVLAAARANPCPGQRGRRPDADRLDESPSRERHACLLPIPCCPCHPWRYFRRRWSSPAGARCGTPPSLSSFLPSCRARCARASSRAAGTAGPP